MLRRLPCFYYEDPEFQLELNLQNDQRDLISLLEEDEFLDCLICTDPRCCCSPHSSLLSTTLSLFSSNSVVYDNNDDGASEDEEKDEEEDEDEDKDEVEDDDDDDEDDDNEDDDNEDDDNEDDDNEDDDNEDDDNDEDDDDDVDDNVDDNVDDVVDDDVDDSVDDNVGDSVDDDDDDSDDDDSDDDEDEDDADDDDDSDDDDDDDASEEVLFFNAAPPAETLPTPRWPQNETSNKPAIKTTEKVTIIALKNWIRASIPDVVQPAASIYFPVPSILLDEVNYSWPANPLSIWSEQRLKETLAREHILNEPEGNNDTVVAFFKCFGGSQVTGKTASTSYASF